MARRFSSLLIVLFFIFLLVPTSYSAPVYGTHMPQKEHWIWGLEGSFIRDRNLDNDEGGIDEGGIKDNRYFLTGSYGIFQWLSFDGKIGAGDVKWESRKNADNLNYSTSFAGGYGFRVRGYENEEWAIKTVAGFQHISVHPETKNQAGDKHEAVVDEWQASMIVSKDVGNLVPYLGGRYGTCELIKKTNEHDRKRLKSEENFGIIVGMDWRIDERTKLNFEGAFLDGGEVAIGISRDF